MFRTQHQPPRRARLLASLAGSAVLALAGCGGQDDATPVGAADQQQAQVDSGIPEACLDAYPAAFTAPDLADATLLPGDWPEPPTGATLCQTTGTADGAVETADYATDAPAAEVLDAYEAALSAYDVAREDQGLGEQLSGTADGVLFEITTRDGAYSVTFATR